MKGKLFPILTFIAVLLLCAIFFLGTNQEEDNWTHKTFQGTVDEFWNDNGNSYFTLITEPYQNKCTFMIDEDSMLAFAFDVGNEVIVESDYSTKHHNGKDIPYPATLIADPNLTDTKN